MRMMRRVISPRLAIRILLNGGLSDDDEENDRLEGVNATSTAWGRASMSCEKHRDAIGRSTTGAPLLAVPRRNNLTEEDILQIAMFFASVVVVVVVFASVSSSVRLSIRAIYSGHHCHYC